MNGERENVSLAPFTTFHIGGPAHFFVEAHSEEEIKDAIAYACERNLPFYPLGAGSNILVPDKGVEGMVLKMAFDDIAFEQEDDEMLLIAGAGTPWEKIVDAAGERALFGIENLAGIPGTIGGASVQNIGAYGAELANVFAYADCIDGVTGTHRRITRAEATFAYRTSFFKTHRAYIITRVALRFSKNASLNIAYPDLARAREEGISLETPLEIARTIRAIRGEKFPLSKEEGTAGSFFKNPVVDEKTLDHLRVHYPDLPIFPIAAGNESASGGKIPLAWILDHVLSLKGFSRERVRLYEEQPLVIVARAGATATEVDIFANEIAKRVLEATGIVIEREVETFGTQPYAF